MPAPTPIAAACIVMYATSGISLAQPSISGAAADDRRPQSRARWSIFGHCASIAAPPGARE